MGKIDLHIHTTASDGRYTPAEIVSMSYERGLSHIAICDHDSINGIQPAQAAAAKLGSLTVIPGVEINTDIPSGELHLLGYYFDMENPELNEMLEQLRNSRLDRAMKMVEKLKKHGVNIDYSRVREIAGTGSVGRPHIAQAMLEKGYITNFKEAFVKYISRGGLAYVERDKITPAEATQLILRAGGIPVLAHPFTSENPEPLIAELKTVGLMGLEVYYNNYTPEQVQELLKIGEKYQLIATGGSDFHGLDAMSEPQLGMVDVPPEVINRLIELHKRS